MSRSGRQPEKHADLGNEAQDESKAKKMSKDKHSNIATLDNDTMVEAYKFLNYCQLAKNSLVSKRFCDLIQTHRHKLALLYVDSISMYSLYRAPAVISIFEKELSLDAYNEWIIRNSYSKEIPIDSQIASAESTQSITNRYGIAALACYKDPSHRLHDKTRVLFAQVEVNHENWPIFQHFVRLVTDPFIYIEYSCLTDQNDVLNLLIGANNSDDNRLQIKKLNFGLNDNCQKSITWIKNHVRCNELRINGDLNQDEAFLDFFVTGANCTPSINCDCRLSTRVVTDFVQKFLDLKNSGESQLVEAIGGHVGGQSVELFNRDYADFLVKEETNEEDNSTWVPYVFEFVNNEIGKKLQLTMENYYCFTIKIYNL